MWVRGLGVRRSTRLIATASGVALAVALLASIGVFLSASKATMTDRSVQRVAVDWQVEAQSGADPGAVLAATTAQPSVRTALPVAFGDSTGFTATAGGSTQTTGPGVVLGLPIGYRTAFPRQIRTLVGGSDGVLLAQQTAANLHASPGDVVSVGRAGLPDAPVTVVGVVDLPQADSLFQHVGAPPGAQPQAPPDNVLLLPVAQWHALFDPLADARPDLIRFQVHARLDRALPTDPAAAYTTTTGAANHLEAALAGAGRVGDNLAAVLDGARSDALYAQALFLFLGLPGAIVAGLLTAAVASAGADRHRREQALLRVRGATRDQLVRLALGESLMIGISGALAGLVVAAGVGRAAFGTATFGTTPLAAAGWAAGGTLAGLAIAATAVASPAWRDARRLTIAAARLTAGQARTPAWQRAGLDLWLLSGAALVFWLTSRGGYQLVLAPEGIPTISVSYWALAGPLLLWLGLGLLVWRAVDAILRHGRPALAAAARPVAGTLAPIVAASMSRQRPQIGRATVLLTLTAAFAVSTAVFNATYRQQAEVDAILTNGADVTVTEPPGVPVGPSAADQLIRTPGVKAVEPLQHRFAYVGADLQDLYGVRPSTIVDAAKLQDAYFAGGTARQLIAALATHPDSLLVSAETVRDFQLHPGDPITLRLQDVRTNRATNVSFHYVGVANEFPTAPSDSFLVANADYITRQTGSDAVGSFLVTIRGDSPRTVADRLRALLGTSATVSDIQSRRDLVGSSLTAIDLSGLTRVELCFALVLAAAAAGLVLALGLTERRQAFTIASAIGATSRQLSGFVWTEAAFVTGTGILTGAAGGWALSETLVKVLTGVFDPPPTTLAVPWTYLALLTAVTVAAVGVAAASTVSATAPWGSTARGKPRRRFGRST